MTALLAGLLLGLMGSLHCIGMCGPLALMVPGNTQNRSWVVNAMLYNGGRVLTYATIGALFGLLGKGLQLAGLQQIVSIAAGIMMLLLVALPRAEVLVKKHMPLPQRTLSKYLGKMVHRRDGFGVLGLGLLNGFLPCGLVYVALMGSLTMQSAAQGATLMALFGLGTIPALLSLRLLGNVVPAALRSRTRKALPVLLVLMGVVFILRGSGLDIPYLSPVIGQVVSASGHCAP